MARTLVYFIDVGQGDSSLIVLPDGSGILIDCYSERAVTALLRDRGVTRLRALVATHLDLDHIAGFRSLIHHYVDRREQGDASLSPLDEIESIWVAPDRSRAHISFEAYALLALTVREARTRGGVRVRSPLRDDGEPPRQVWSSPEDQALRLELLFPYWATYIEGFLAARRDGNPLSCVLRLCSGSRSVMIAGDAILRSFEELHEQEPSELAATVLRSPHHGGDIRELAASWREYEDLYVRTLPQFVVHSVGTHNSHGHPNPDHLAASTRGGACHVMCTQMTGSCHADLADVRLQRSAFLEVAYPDYRAAHRSEDVNPGGVPCAGTVLLVLDGEELAVFPPPNEHRTFVETLTSPQCLAATQESDP